MTVLYFHNSILYEGESNDTFFKGFWNFFREVKKVFQGFPSLQFIRQVIFSFSIVFFTHCFLTKIEDNNELKFVKDNFLPSSEQVLKLIHFLKKCSIAG